MTPSSASRERRWRSYGNGPLPTPQQALDEPFCAFPSWFPRVGSAYRNKTRWLNQCTCCAHLLPNPRPPVGCTTGSYLEARAGVHTKLHSDVARETLPAAALRIPLRPALSPRFYGPRLERGASCCG